MKFAFYTLGCKVNQYETQAMERLLLKAGHTLGRWDEDCDGYILNTCSVTAASDKKCRNMLRRVRREHPEAAVGVCGCYAQVKPDDVRALGADVLGGTAERSAFLRAVAETAITKKPRELWTPSLEHRSFERLPAGGLAARTRAMLKVQDGCNNYCSYCVIPYARGPARSLPLSEAAEQAKGLAAEGYREIVVTGVEISSWGVDLPGEARLSGLIEAICAAAPEVRVRLGSLEPRVVTEDFCRSLAGLSNLCPQFHLSLQSGSDSVLKRMNRKYDTARYFESVTLLRRFFPGCALTTDLIVAFPGESEAEFAESLAFLEKCAFAAVHVFPYSRREGTPAARMAGQHPNAVKEERAARAGALAHALSRTYREGMIGSLRRVLFEQAEGEFFTGHAENYVKVYVPAPAPRNEVREVKITGLHEDGVLGELLP